MSACIGTGGCPTVDEKLVAQWLALDPLSARSAHGIAVATRDAKEAVKALGGDMKRQTQPTRIHLFRNPKKPDLLIGETDDSEAEPARVIPTALMESYLRHPSQVRAPKAS